MDIHLPGKKASHMKNWKWLNKIKVEHLKWNLSEPARLDANSSAFGGRLTLFCLVSRSPTWYLNLPLFTSTNIEYLVKK